MIKRLLVVMSCLAFQISLTQAQTPGNSLDFDGSNDYVSTSIPTVITNLGTSDFTVETWVKRTSSSTSRILFAQVSTSTYVSILLNTSGIPYVYINNNGSTTSINTQTALTYNQWEHFAFTWNASTSTITAYINGVQTTNAGGGGSSSGSSGLMTIGSRTDGTQNFGGELDEFRIWNVARTPCEIAATMNSDFTTTQPNLVAYYNFNQGSASGSNSTVTTLNDFTSNYNGTLTNFALTGTTSNWVSSSATITLVNQTTPTIITADTVSACDSYTWANGITYTTNTTAIDTFSNVAGCDSIVTLNLTLSSSSTSTDIISACGSYLWIDGNNYSSSNNTATYTLPNANGCDSVITLDLTILPTSTYTDVINTCDSLTWINGITYTSSNSTATDTLTNSAGCDSIVYLDLTIGQTTYGTDSLRACNSYTWIDGITYTSSNNSATYTLTNGSGCDSIIALNLTIDTVDLSFILSLDGTDISMYQAGANYQWLDCNENYNPIFGDTNQSFTASVSGSYAVEIATEYCIDTTDCFSLIGVGIESYDILEESVMYPNPNNGEFTLDFGREIQDVTISIFSITGQEVYVNKIASTSLVEIQFEGASGIYMCQIKNSEGIKKTYRLIKK